MEPGPIWSSYGKVLGLFVQGSAASNKHKFSAFQRIAA